MIQRGSGYWDWKAISPPDSLIATPLGWSSTRLAFLVDKSVSWALKTHPGVMRPHPILRFCERHNNHRRYHGGGSTKETRECDTTWIHRIIVGRCQAVLAGRSECMAGCGRYPFLSEWCSTILACERAGDCPQGYWRVILRYNESSFSALLSPKTRSPVVNIVERIKITEAVAHLRLPIMPTHTLSRNNKLVAPLWFIFSAKG